jgi:alanyl aminopeptidase
MRWWVVCGVVACAAGAPKEAPRATVAVPAPVAAPFPADAPFRLPHTFEPQRYRARLEIGDKQFTGHVEIDGTLSEAASLIWLHAVDLTVTRAQAMSGNTAIDLEVSGRRKDQLLGFRSPHSLQAGRWTLAIEYTGRIREAGPPVHEIGGPDHDRWATGVFKRVMEDRSYVYTQGEAIYARQIFPCIDEPDRKVPWQLTLDVAKDVIAASNTPIVREAPLDGDHKRVEFAETLPLPSYLIAFAVGPFDVVDGGASKSGVPIRILVGHGHAANAAWAARETKRILDFLEDWLAVPFAYPKLDIVSAPHLGWGAMENPGLVTVDEKQLEVFHSRQTLSHELAHHWFGDLVTMRWWDDIWLNESFANWLAIKVELHLNGHDDDRLGLRERALRLSGMSPVRVAVSTNAALAAHGFAPEASLASGAAVLMILEAHFGTQRLQDTMRAYLSAHLHGNVDTNDFATALNSVTNTQVPLGELLEHGLPTIRPEFSCEKGHAKLRTGTVPWPTVFCVAYDHDGKRDKGCVMLDAQHDTIELPAKTCPRWVMPDADVTGMYRVQWTSTLLKPLLSDGWSALSHDERLTLFDEEADAPLDFEIFTKLLGEANGIRPGSQARYLARMALYVPDDLRSRFNGWVASQFGRRAHAVKFEPRDEQGADWEDISIVRLVASIGDGDLAKAASEVASRHEQLPETYVYFQTVLRVAATNDAALRDRLIDELVRDGSSRNWRVSAISEALADVPTIYDAFKKDPSLLKRIDGPLLANLVARTCTQQGSADLRELAAQTSSTILEHAIGRSDKCLYKKSTLDPIFRAWLAPKRAKP